MVFKFQFGSYKFLLLHNLVHTHLTSIVHFMLSYLLYKALRDFAKQYTIDTFVQK